MDFLEEFNKKIKEIDNVPDKPKINHSEQKRQEDLTKVHGELYTIRKRSLPVGLDVPVMWNLPKKDAEMWITKRLKPKLIDEEKKIVHYYDKVKQSGYKAGVYDNDLPSLTKEDNHEIEIIKGQKAYEPEWKG